MAPKKRNEQKVSDADKSASGDLTEPKGVRRGQALRRPGPRAQANARRVIAFSQKAPSVLFPQWARTATCVILWLGMTPIYIGLIAPYSAYSSAIMMTLGLALFAGLAPHLWPSKTPPWRTVWWAWAASWVVGLTLLTTGLYAFALMGATIVGFSVVLLRANRNWSHLRGLIRSWRALR